MIINLTLNGGTLEVKDGGFLGMMKVGDKIGLEIYDLNSNQLALVKAGDGSITVVGCTEVKLDIDVVTGMNNPHTDGYKNTLMVTTFADDGKVSVTAVCIVAQYGKFFLRTQDTYKVQGYRDGNITVFPELTRKQMGWAQLADVATLHYGEHPEREGFPPVSQYVEPAKPDTSTLKENEVLVTFWAPGRQTGGGLTSDGKFVSLNWIDIERPARVEATFLVAGEVVTADIRPNDRKGFVGKQIRRPVVVNVATQCLTVPIGDHKLDWTPAGK